MAGLLRRQGVAIALENLAGRIAFEKREVAGRGGIGGAALGDDDALVEWGVERGGDFNPATLVPEFRREDKRARNETSIGVTGFDELGGLRDVFTGDNFESSGRGEAEVTNQNKKSIFRIDWACRSRAPGASGAMLKRRDGREYKQRRTKERRVINPTAQIARDTLHHGLQVTPLGLVRHWAVDAVQ